MSNTPDSLQKAIDNATAERDGRRVLPCADAFALAQQAQVDLFDIARLCNQEGIKIVQCQLGCF